MIGAEVFKGITKDGEGALWKIPSDLPYFEGHFPGNPIFPAVAIVDATVYSLRFMGETNVTISHISAAKFLSPIQPGQSVRIEFKKLGEKDWQAEWKDEASQKLLASLRLNL